MKKFRCVVCGYIHEGAEAPDICPVCKAGKDKFVEVVEKNGHVQFVAMFTQVKIHQQNVQLVQHQQKNL